MAASNINRVIITGNLTRDPETRALPNGTSVVSLRVAVNGRRKDNQSGQWVDKPNFFDVTVFGATGENAAKYLSRGRGVAIDGRLDWREWQDKDGNKRQTVEIIADNVQFLSSPDGGQGGGGGGYNQQAAGGYNDGGGARPANGGYDRAPAPASGAYGQPAPAAAPAAAPAYGSDVAVDRSDFAPAPRGGLADPGEDDIPF
jgi:single-strand DNA-binding protein